MWKYRCKSHLIALVVAFLVGLCLSAVVFASGIDMSSDMLSSSLSSVPGVDTESLKQVLTYLQNKRRHPMVSPFILSFSGNTDLHVCTFFLNSGFLTGKSA